MNHQICIALAIFIGGMPLVAAPAEPGSEARAAARLIASVEQPLAKRDLKSYCAAVHGTPDYASYVARACQAGVKNNVKKPEDCSDTNIKQEIENVIGRCASMTAEQFDTTAKRWDEVREKFIKEMAAKKVNGEAVLEEARARLR